MMVSGRGKVLDPRAIAFGRSALVLLAGICISLSSSSLIGQSSEGELLQENKPIERSISGGQTHRYRVSVNAGEYARAVVDQRGIDVVTRLFAPDGSLITFIDNPNGSQGADPVHIVAETGGIYRIEVSVYDKIANGRYEVRLAERRPIAQIDRDRYAARQAFDAAESFVADGKRVSYERAIEKYLAAAAQYRTLSETSEEYTSLFGLGMAYQRVGEQLKALDAFGQALVIAQAMGDKYRQGRMVEFIAGVHKSTGDLDKGLQGQIEAAKLFQAVGDRVKEVEMLDSLGNTYNTLGEHQLARDHFNRAMAIYRELGYRDAESYILRAIGNSYSLEYEWAKALEYYKKALAVAQAAGSKIAEASNVALIADEYARAGDRSKALANIERALELSKSFANGTSELGVMFSAGSTYYRLGEYDKALTFYETPLRHYRSVGHKRSEAVTLKRMAEALREKGKLADAKAALERSIELMEFVRDHAGGPEQRASFVATLYTVYETYIDVQMRLHEAVPSAGHNEAALAFAEKVKMRSLVELLTKARVDIRDGLDKRLVERERLAKDAITEKLDELSALLRRKFTDEERTAVERELGQLREDLLVIQSEIRKSDPHYASVAAPQHLSVRDIQEKVLDDETILLEYKLEDERSYLWAVTRDNVQSYRLPGGIQIAAQARLVYELLSNNQNVREPAGEALYRQEAGKLSRMILGPLAGRLGNKRLLIVADGALQYLSFGALPSPSAKNGESRLLIADHEIVSLPSASVLDVLRREYGSREPAPKAAAIFADPVYTPDDARVDRKSEAVRSGGTANGFKRLLFSRGEAEAIVSVTPERSNLLALDFEPDRQLAMSPQLGNYRFVHFSTHGVLNSRRPELSGLVLSQVSRTGQPQDGLLRLHEIYNLRLNADLVVLSACQTALGKDVRGEGLIGLTRGFMYAGSPRVVASLWQVDDAATAALMKEFYKGMLVKDMTPAAALRAAQLEVQKRKAWRSPYYWAAFVLQGEWK